jgi:uncharacterized LabA/DUF88 family protein
MKRIVLIDGENLCYGLRELLGKNGQKADRETLKDYNFRGLVEEMLADGKPNEVLWFGARLRKYNQTEEFEQKTTTAVAFQARQVNLLQSQKITFIKVGYLRARESDPCSKCGNTELYLAEKGVDVGLAIRMLQEAKKGVELVIVSADTDLLPAIKVAKKSGGQIMSIQYEYRPITALSQNVNSTRIISRPLAEKYRGVK